MDDIDILTEREERFAPYMLASSKRPEGPAPTGECLYCATPTAHRWCDAGCRDGWQKEQR